MTRVAQLGERWTSNPDVVGSNPTSGRGFRSSTIHSKNQSSINSELHRRLTYTKNDVYIVFYENQDTRFFNNHECNAAENPWN